MKWCIWCVCVQQRSALFKELDKLKASGGLMSSSNWQEVRRVLDPLVASHAASTATAHMEHVPASTSGAKDGDGEKAIDAPAPPVSSSKRTKDPLFDALHGTHAQTWFSEYLLQLFGVCFFLASFI